MPWGKVLRGGLLHETERLAGAEPRHGNAGDGRRGIEVVARDELRTQYPAHVKQAAERHHLIGLVGDVKVADIFQLPAKVGVGLHAHLEALVEFVEQVDVGRPQISLQRPGNIVERDPEGFRHRSVDIQEELRAAGAEGGKTDAQKPGPVARDAQHLLHCFLQFAETRAAAIFDDHLEPEGVSQARDRRGRQYRNLRALKGKKFLPAAWRESSPEKNRAGVGPSLHT